MIKALESHPECRRPQKWPKTDRNQDFELIFLEKYKTM